MRRQNKVKNFLILKSLQVNSFDKLNQLITTLNLSRKQSSEEIKNDYIYSYNLANMISCN
jgi:hypothetical protein